MAAFMDRYANDAAEQRLRNGRNDEFHKRYRFSKLTFDFICGLVCERLEPIACDWCRIQPTRTGDHLDMVCVREIASRSNQFSQSRYE